MIPDSERASQEGARENNILPNKGFNDLYDLFYHKGISNRNEIVSLLVTKPVTDSLSTAAVVDREIVGCPGDEDTPETRKKRVGVLCAWLDQSINHLSALPLTVFLYDWSC